MLYDHDHQDGAAATPSLENWRDRITPIVIFATGVVLIAAAALQALRSDFELSAPLLGLGVVYLVWGRWARTSPKLHRPVLLMTMLAMWSALLAVLGWVPGVVGIGVLIVALTGVVAGQRLMWMSIAALTVAGTSVAFAIHHGVLALPRSALREHGDPVNWLATGGVAFSCMVMGTAVIRRTVGVHTSLLGRVQRTVRLLQRQSEERARLRSEEEALLGALDPSRRVRVASAVGPLLGHVFNNALTAGLTATETAIDSGDADAARDAADVVEQVVATCLDGASYLLSLARPASDSDELADVRQVDELIERARQRLPHGIELQTRSEASGPLPITTSQLDELVTLLLSYAGQQWRRAETVFLRSAPHESAGSVALQRGDWVVIELDGPRSEEPVEPTIITVLAESARRAGAVLQTAKTAERQALRLYIPRSLMTEPPGDVVAPPPSAERPLRVLLGAAAILTIVAAVALAHGDPERAGLWLGTGALMFVPLSWGALASKISSAGRLLAFAAPISGAAALTLMVHGYTRPLAIALLYVACLAAATYGSRRAIAVALALVVTAFGVGAALHAGAPAPPLHTAADFFRYGLLVPGVCALGALIVVDPLERIRRALPELESARARLEAERAGVAAEDDSLGTLRAAHERVDEMAAAGRHVTVLAHDINNCLTVMSGWSDLLQITDDEDEARDALIAMHQACRHVQAVVESFDSGALSRAIDPIDLNAELLAMRPLFESLAGPGQSIHVTTDGEVGWVAGDRQLLRRAVLNLVTNARDAVARDGRIDIRTAQTPDGPMLVVRDDGDGMDNETLARASEPFFTTKGRKGTGLGLHSVHEIAEHIGAVVTIESEQDDGTQVTILFRAATPTQKPAESAAAGDDVRRVLIVESEPLVARCLDTGLRLGGIGAVRVPTPQDAIEAMQDGEFDALCYDAVASRSETDDMLAEFARHHPNASIVLMASTTPVPLPFGEVKALRVLHKPFSTRDLLAVLR